LCFIAKNWIKIAATEKTTVARMAASILGIRTAATTPISTELNPMMPALKIEFSMPRSEDIKKLVAMPTTEYIPIRGWINTMEVKIKSPKSLFSIKKTWLKLLRNALR
jgi:hypothetical protein